jgi:hypothetical protein
MSDADQLNTLGQKMTDALIASYGMSAPGAHLAFLPGGASVPADIVQSGVINPTQMQTWLSINFDSPFITSVADGAVHQKDPSHGSVSRIYTIAATSAQPLGHPDDDSWKRLSGQIADAQRSLGPPDAQKLIVCEPDDWVLPSNAGYWTAFDSTQSSSTSSTATTTPRQTVGRWRHWMPVKPKVNPLFWMIRSLPADPVSPDLHVTPAVPAATARTSAAAFRMSEIAIVRAPSSPPPRIDRVAAMVTETPTFADRSSPARYPLWTNRAHLAAINTRSLFDTAKPVANVTATTTSTIKVHLEHQCVTLGYYSAGQPWWDGVFLADTGWFIPGMPRGGLLPVPDTTDDQLAYGLPTAMIIVRNLRVSGIWSAEAAAALSSPGGTLGPLSLFGAAAKAEADGVTVTYAHDGMQVVALLCSEIPVLPPVDPPAPSSSTVSGEPASP